MNLKDIYDVISYINSKIDPNKNDPITMALVRLTLYAIQLAQKLESKE